MTSWVLQVEVRDISEQLLCSLTCKKKLSKQVTADASTIVDVDSSVTATEKGGGKVKTR